MYSFGNGSGKIVAGAVALFVSLTLAQTAGATAVVAPSAVATEALTPESDALRLALANPDVGGEAAAHYNANGYSKIWLKPGGDDLSAQALIAVLEQAASHGLPVGRYDVPLLKTALQAAANDPAAAAIAELRLTQAYLAYARDVSTGVLEPRTVDRELHVYPERLDPSVLLSMATSATDMARHLEKLAPQGETYVRLRAELSELTSLAPDAWGALVPEGGSIRIGERGPRIEAMRARLTAMGDHVVQATTDADGVSEGGVSADGVVFDPAIYDVTLEDSVRGFQRRHGLNDDGIAGRRTVAAMNATVEERIGQVTVALERLRWMNKDLGERHVYVNQADFTVQLFDKGDVVFQERVVIGKARKHRTPEFSDEMTYMVFNPIWHVPYSIASEEILPKLREDPEYLLKKNMRLLTRDGGEGPDATLTDWSLYSENDFPYLVKQGSGGGNALGRVKFMFPNQFAIYLHDTPSKRLFNKDARAFSHGCVRVRDPMAFARALLSVQTNDPEAFVQRQLARTGERRVNLKKPVPVHLTYLTAWVDDQGTWQFRDDVYGRDGRILAALTAAGVTSPQTGG